MHDEPASHDPAPGVRPIDHAADVGLDIDAPDLPALLDRAARGMVALLAGEEAGDETDATVDGSRRGEERAQRDITVDAADAAQLLADWLRELLYLHEVHRLEYAGAEFIELTETRVRARVSLARAAATPVREIKGVTYHGLHATPTAHGWSATVIFDV